MADNDRRNPSADGPIGEIKVLEEIALYSWWEEMGTEEEVFKALGIYVAAGRPLRVSIEMHTQRPTLSYGELFEYLPRQGWTQFAALPWPVMTRNQPPPDAVGRDLARLVRTFTDTLSAIDRHRQSVKASLRDVMDELVVGEATQ